MSNEIEKTEQVNQIQQLATTGELNEAGKFALLQREAKLLASSKIVPKDYQGNMSNCFIALDIAKQIGANYLTVMQNLHIIHGKPGWASTFVIASINNCKRFTTLRYRFEGEGDTRSCVAYATDRETGEVVESTKVDMEMARAEGWLGKAGSKWKTMPDQMLMYRTATFFGRVYAPELLMGLSTQDEILDMGENRSIKIAETELVDTDETFDLGEIPPTNEDEIPMDDVVTSEEPQSEETQTEEEEKPARTRRTKEQIESDNIEELAKLLVENEIHRNTADAWAKSIGKDIEDPVFIKQVLSKPKKAVEQMKALNHDG